MHSVRELTNAANGLSTQARAVYSCEYMRTIACGTCVILLIQLAIPWRIIASVFEAVMLVLLMLSVSPTHEYCDASTPWCITEIMMMNARILISMVVVGLGHRFSPSGGTVVKCFERRVALQFARLVDQLLMVAIGHDDTADSGGVSPAPHGIHHQQQPPATAIHHLPLETVREESLSGDESDSWHIM
jgi:hypothetical protein